LLLHHFKELFILPGLFQSGSLTFGTSKIMLQKLPAKKKIIFFLAPRNKLPDTHAIN
jgi:hypothetical protein